MSFWLLLLPVLAWADTTVVFGGETTEGDVRRAWLQTDGRDVGVDFVHVDRVFDPAEPAVLLGDTAELPCGDAPATAADLDTLNEQVEFLSLSMDYLAATGALDKIERLLPCLVEVPDNAALSRYHFSRGLIAWHADGEAAATRRFEEALLTAPFLQWDDRHPPQIKAAFDRAREGALAAETAFFSVSSGIVEAGTFWVDGVALDRRTRTATLYEGTHLLQWIPDAGEGKSWLVPVDGGDFVTLVARDDAVVALLSGQADPGITEFALARTLAPVARDAGAQLTVAADDELLLFHDYDAAAGRWRLADIDALQRRRQTGRLVRNVGIGMLGGGAVLGGLGLGFAIEGSQEAVGIQEELFGEEGEIGDGISVGLRSELGQGAQEHVAALRRHEVGVALSTVGFSITLGGIPLTGIGAQRARAQQGNRR